MTFEPGLPSNRRCLNKLCENYGVGDLRKTRYFGRYGKKGRKRFQCKACKKTFSETREQKVYQKKHPTKALKTKELRRKGLSIRNIAKVLKASTTSIQRWIKE